MTKRPSPFEISIYRQSKIHLNDYENDLTALKEMEERTLKKLMEGSKKCEPKDLNCNCEIQASGHGDKNFMQKCVTNYFTVNGRIINEGGRKIITPSEMITRCFFCDSKTNSPHQCVECLELYCSACSFVNYESFDDNRTCLSCS